MKKATIVHHQGFGDLFTSNSLCNFYSKKYDELLVLVLDESRKIIIDKMYFSNPKIRCEIAKCTHNNSYGSSCLICMTPGNPFSCPRNGSFKCQYIDYSQYIDYENIKIGCFKENYFKWDNLLKENRNNGTSFSHSFYEYEGINKNDRIEHFNISRDYINENNNFKNLKIFDYIVLHDDKKRNLIASKLQTNLNVYQLDGSSDNMIDQIKIIENAKEIHLIDSSWSVMIYFLSFKNDLIKNIPKYLHAYAMSNRDLSIYDDPIPDNWIVIN